MMERHEVLLSVGLALAVSTAQAAQRETGLERLNVARAEVSGRTAAFTGATQGRVFTLEPGASALVRREFSASRPVHRAYGFSADGTRVAYRALDGQRPTGTLWTEELGTGNATALPLPGYVIEAAWSPADPGLIAYTYSSGEGDYGVALFDLARGEMRDVQSKHVLADHLAWDANGAGIYYFDAVDHVRQSRDILTGRPMHESTYAELSPRYFALATGAARELPLTAVPAGFPVLKQSARPELLSEPVFELPRRAGAERFEAADLPDDIYAFSVVVPDRGLEVLGRNLLGDGPLSVRTQPAGEARQVAEGKLLAVLAEGLVVSANLGFGRATNLVRWDGTTTEIARAVVSYNLPLKSSYVTQGGCSYPAPGNCNSGFSHTCGSSMAYAYDIWQSGGHVLASATGTVANRMNTVTCNSCDSSGCADYVAGCTNANSGWGNAVVIEHGDASWTKYTHMAYNSVQVAVGNSVCPGRYIGNQGHTGCTSGSGCGDHLHFQRQNGSGFSSTSIAIDFADAADPLSCGSTYTSASTETTTCGGGTYTFTCDNGQGCYSAFGPSQYWHTQTTCGGTSLGQNGSMIWTYVNGTVKSNYARWTPTLSGSGNYTVSVFIPRCYGTSQQARYTIVANGSTFSATVNQNAIYDQWVTLGTYFFAASGTQYVELADNTGEAASTLRQLAFDAVRFSK
jgi:hypothetical protein